MPPSYNPYQVFFRRKSSPTLRTSDKHDKDGRLLPSSTSTPISPAFFLSTSPTADISQSERRLLRKGMRQSQAFGDIITPSLTDEGGKGARVEPQGSRRNASDHSHKPDRNETGPPSSATQSRPSRHDSRPSFSSSKTRKSTSSLPHSVASDPGYSAVFKDGAFPQLPERHFSSSAVNSCPVIADPVRRSGDSIRLDNRSVGRFESKRPSTADGTPTLPSGGIRNRPIAEQAKRVGDVLQFDVCPTEKVAEASIARKRPSTAQGYQTVPSGHLSTRRDTGLGSEPEKRLGEFRPIDVYSTEKIVEDVFSRKGSWTAQGYQTSPYQRLNTRPAGERQWDPAQRTRKPSQPETRSTRKFSQDSLSEKRPWTSQGYQTLPSASLGSFPMIERELEQVRRIGTLPPLDIHSAEKVNTAPMSQKRPSTAHGYRQTPLSSGTARAGLERRASLDLVSPGDTPSSTMLRSMSRKSLLTWSKKSRENQLPDNISADILNRGGSLRLQPLSEKEKSLHVKRARKMAQMFGSEPPPELYQITRADDEDDPSIHEDKYTSLATLPSTSTDNLLAPHPDPQAQEDSNESSSVEPSPSHATPTIAPEPGPLRQTEYDAPSPLSPAPFSTVVPFSSYRPSIASSTKHPAPDASQHGQNAAPAVSEKDFRRRRLRAAKLSNFFGVEYQDIKPFIPESAPSRPGTARDTYVAVEIAIGDTFSHRNQHQSNHKEADMRDVIHALRSMKAS